MLFKVFLPEALDGLAGMILLTLSFALTLVAVVTHRRRTTSAETPVDLQNTVDGDQNGRHNPTSNAAPPLGLRFTLMAIVFAVFLFTSAVPLVRHLLSGQIADSQAPCKPREDLVGAYNNLGNYRSGHDLT
ncbi:hypothetical protein CYMTET_32105 [Cymbomonas tetramitiformis]|uniref:Uncharacterized protein n=1 Tax=Cymbomonas tetramitiformis TaxID=36881 RepID=A0AAE0KS67_9CHLO|nr:hypothetical protein CYMTET_32105 [Cymbomonas tetramitiformis]